MRRRRGRRVGCYSAAPPVVAAKRGAGHPEEYPAHTFASYLRLVRHLKEADFVPLYILYRVARILRCVAARTSSDFLAGLQSLLALPKGDADQLATLTVTEGDESFEPVLLLQYGQDMLFHIAQTLIHLVGGSLQCAHPRVHGRITPFSRLKSPASRLFPPQEHDATTPTPARTSDRGSLRRKRITPVRLPLGAVREGAR